MMAEEALLKITEGIVEVIVDNEASADNLAIVRKEQCFIFRNDQRQQRLAGEDS